MAQTGNCLFKYIHRHWSSLIPLLIEFLNIKHERKLTFKTILYICQAVRKRSTLNKKLKTVATTNESEKENKKPRVELIENYVANRPTRKQLSLLNKGWNHTVKGQIFLKEEVTMDLQARIK